MSYIVGLREQNLGAAVHGGAISFFGEIRPSPPL